MNIKKVCLSQTIMIKDKLKTFLLAFILPLKKFLKINSFVNVTKFLFFTSTYSIFSCNYFMYFIKYRRWKITKYIKNKNNLLARLLLPLWQTNKLILCKTAVTTKRICNEKGMPPCKNFITCAKTTFFKTN